MFSRCLQDFSRLLSGCSGGIWWSFQMKVWTLEIQRNPMMPNYSIIRWSQQLLFDDPQVFDDPQLFVDQLEVWTLIIEKSTVVGDTSITDGLVKWYPAGQWATKDIPKSLTATISTSTSLFSKENFECGKVLMFNVKCAICSAQCETQGGKLWAISMQMKGLPPAEILRWVIVLRNIFFSTAE